MTRNAILVIGSANMDLVVTTQRFPQPGETAFGNKFGMYPGSNMNLTPDNIENKREVFAAMQLVLLQLEIPLETVTQSARLAKAQGAIVILNPAPARKLPRDIFALVDYLIPNENETEILAGVAVTDENTARHAAWKLLGQGVNNVIITMGEKGAQSSMPTMEELQDFLS